MTLTEQDRRYAEGSSRFAFAHARHYTESKAAGDKTLANYHRREVVQIAKWLEDGRTKCAKRDGVNGRIPYRRSCCPHGSSSSFTRRKRKSFASAACFWCKA